ncbi:MAG TPA: relaxase/mobilization nuclease domain-containing protein [Azospirillum sp.]|nr:relaxase/mobilization nuclease domain-containing protein [Azospirillum sp.]
MGNRDDLWRLPPTLQGGDVRFTPTAEPPPPSCAGKARGPRTAATPPEVVVKLTGRARGRAGHLGEQFDYITRNGRLAAETQDGEIVTDRGRLRDIHDDWLLANTAEGRGTAAANAAQSVALTLSMPRGTPADRVEAAARRWARDTFADRHDWLLARHDDTGHPHVHVAVRAVGRGGRRLAPGPADLQRWREGFARELRRLGVDAEATPRVARSRGHRPDHRPAQTVDQGRHTLRADTAIQQTRTTDTRSPAPPSPAEPDRLLGLPGTSLPRMPDPAPPPRPHPRGRG